MKQKTDFIFFGLTGLLIASTIILSQLYDYELSVNNYLAFITWPTTLFLRLKIKKRKRYPLGIIIILALFNVVNFSIGSWTFKLGINSSVPIETPGINPIILIVAIAYYFVNKKAINNILSNFFKGTEQDRNEEYQKTVDFYVKRFSSCNEEELKGVLENYKDYPAPAQTALRQLQEGNGNAI